MILATRPTARRRYDPKFKLRLPIYNIVYEEGSSYNCWVTTSYNNYFLHFQSPNRRSKPLDVISTIKCACRPNFTFFGIFLLFIKHFLKLLIQWSRKFYCFYCSEKNSNFKKCLINGKKIPKNVKFGLQVHFNMEITSNGSDRSFGLSKWKYGVEYKCVLLHGVA